MHARKKGAEGLAAADLHSYDLKIERDGERWRFLGRRPRKTEGGENGHFWIINVKGG